MSYAECVKEAGGIPLHFPPLSSEFILDILSEIDGLVLTGGADINPAYYGEEISASVSLSPDQRTDFDMAFFRASLEAGKSILAICHGMQVLNVALGGALYQDVPTQVPGAIAHRGDKDSIPARHTVLVESGSRLGEVMGGLLQFEVSSTHHQAVKTLGKELRVNARAPDGIIEGIEPPGYPKVLGVQWHPEKDPQSEPTRRLFKGLIRMSSCPFGHG